MCRGQWAVSETQLKQRFKPDKCHADCSEQATAVNSMHRLKGEKGNTTESTKRSKYTEKTHKYYIADIYFGATKKCL